MSINAVDYAVHLILAAKKLPVNSRRELIIVHQPPSCVNVIRIVEVDLTDTLEVSSLGNCRAKKNAHDPISRDTALAIYSDLLPLGF